MERAAKAALVALALSACARHARDEPAADAALAPLSEQRASALQPSASASAPSAPVASDNLLAAPAPDAGTEPAPADVVYPFNAALPGRELALRGLASKFASLTSGQCRAELARRKIATSRPRKAASGVAAPLRLDGPLHGVRFVAPGPKSVYGTLDCRLALALDELAALLAQRGVALVRVDNMYRPKAHLPGQRKPSQHAYGLAIDIVGFELASGESLEVERDWHGELGPAPCGPSARLTQPVDAAVNLRNLVCEVARSGIFHHLLTPSYDAAHKNHVHFDIKRDAKEILVK